MVDCPRFTSCYPVLYNHEKPLLNMIRLDLYTQPVQAKYIKMSVLVIFDLIGVDLVVRPQNLHDHILSYIGNCVKLHLFYYNRNIQYLEINML